MGLPGILQSGENRIDLIYGVLLLVATVLGSQRVRVFLGQQGISLRFVVGLWLVCAGLLAFRAFGWSLYYIQARSMQPTLQPWDVVVVRSHDWIPPTPKRGDVVIFKAPDGRDYIKRVAALAGEVWEGRRVGDSCIFVLGDNLPRSVDSRALGDIPIRKIRGRVVYRIWPFSSWGSIPKIPAKI